MSEQPTYRSFRYSIDVAPPEGVDVQAWHSKFLAAIITAMRDLDGSLLVDGKMQPCVRVKELIERRMQ